MLGSMSEPTTLRAGDSCTWSRTDLTDYPSEAGWSLKYRLLWPTGTAVDITTTATGDGYSVSLSATETHNWPAGAATLVSYVERTDERVTLGQQAIAILPDLTTAATFDGRSANRIALDNARAALQAYLAGGKAHIAEYDIAGRRVKFRDSQEITDLIQHYEREVFRETASQALLSGGSPGRVITRF
jgi:hypothetical protein